VIVTSWTCTALWLGSLLNINLFIRIRTRRSKCMHFGVAQLTWDWLRGGFTLESWLPSKPRHLTRIDTQLKLESLTFLFCGMDKRKPFCQSFRYKTLTWSLFYLLSKQFKTYLEKIIQFCKLPIISTTHDSLKKWQKKFWYIYIYNFEFKK
jgi:hypothetical protein